MSLLEVNELAIDYDGQVAVRDISFSVEKGESVGLVGESGSGKSQTALGIIGLLPANACVRGSVRFDGNELLGRTGHEFDEFRGTRIGMVFQDPMQALNPFVSVGTQLSRVLRQHGLATGEAARAKVVEMLDRVGLPDPGRHYRLFPHELSGGMRQRVMIASALLAGPDLLIADEPTTALDTTVQAQILDLLETVRDDTALLLITHDLGIVAGRCGRVVVLADGSVIEAGATRDVFAGPQHEHTVALIDAAPRLDRGQVPEAAAGETVLSIEAASVAYGGGSELAAVRGVDLSLRAGETVAVVGESGSGKSSLLRAALGLVPLRSGRIVFCGANLPAELAGRDRTTRRGLQLVFQDPAASLNPQMRVHRIVAEPLVVHESELTAAERREKAAAIVRRTGLGDEFLDRYPHELSGGQAQRVAIARALVLRPTVLFCDEAVAALDGTVREQVLSLLREFQAETGMAIVFVTHDLAVVRSISHRVLVMYLGGLVEEARTGDLFSGPRHPYTRALLDAVPVPDPDAPGGRTSITGEAPSAVTPPPGCSFHPRCPLAIERCSDEKPQARHIDGTLVSCHLAEESAAARR